LALSGDREGGSIFRVELYRKVRLACRDGMSERAAARHLGVSRESVKKMLSFSVPPGYRRRAEIRRPKLDGFTEIIEQWLAGC
jgi:transposase